MKREDGERVGILATVRAVREAVAPLGRRRLLVATLAIAGTVVVVGVTFTAGSMALTSQPSFCGGCHPMKKFVRSWETSSHKTVNCERCHTTPGLFGFVGGKIAGLQVVVNYFRGNYEDYSFNAAVGNAACEQCHEKILEKNIRSKRTVNTIVSHRSILEAGGKCVSCHSTVAHGSAVKPGARTYPTMAVCFKCHNDKTAPLRCSLCHPGRETPRNRQK